jgi:hypothetical protein
MNYIVEIGDAEGATALKEYQTDSPSEVQQAVERDLQDYPRVHILKVWVEDR